MIPDTLLEVLSRSYEPPHWAIRELLRDGPASVREAIELARDVVTRADLASLGPESLEQSEILFAGDEETRARLFVVSREAASRIQAQRLALATHLSDVPPYGHPALRGLAPDEEGLVRLSDFEVDGDALCRNGFAFFILPGVPGANANYWLIHELRRAGIADAVRVRLDPLLYGPADVLRGRFYRARLYGRDLDWERIRGLREPEHGRWSPGGLSRGYLFTDYAWIPHANEVDFHCEELPLTEEVAVRGTRYLHAIYKKDSDQIIHLDGATRILTASELQARADAHVRNAGKVGARVKIFRTDRAVEPSVLGAIAEAFFFWNYDVPRYFGAPIHPDL